MSRPTRATTPFSERLRSIPRALLEELQIAPTPPQSNDRMVVLCAWSPAEAEQRRVEAEALLALYLPEIRSFEFAMVCDGSVQTPEAYVAGYLAWVYDGDAPL